MFRDSNRTVFILGAGASWHYGYPTGETLVEKIIEKATIALRYLEHSARVGNPEVPNYLADGPQFTKAAAVCRKLKNGLEQVNPLVIDYYLGWNTDLQDIGRLLIAWVILECEYKSKGRNINRNATQIDGAPKHHDNWVRFIVHQIAIHCKESSDLLLNKVSFVTFNYEVSPETALRNGLDHIQLFAKEDIERFMDGRVVHIYGKVRQPHIQSKVDWNFQLIDPQLLGGRTGNYNATMKMLLDAAYPHHPQHHHFRRSYPFWCSGKRLAFLNGRCRDIFAIDQEMLTKTRRDYRLLSSAHCGGRLPIF
jgi:hypothetical protein